MKSVQERREDEEGFSSWNDQARPPEDVLSRNEKSKRKEKKHKNQEETTTSGTKHGNANGSSRKLPAAEQHSETEVRLETKHGNADGLRPRPPNNEPKIVVRFRTEEGISIQVRETLRQMMPLASKLSVFAVFVGVCLMVNKPPNDGIISNDVLVERSVRVRLMTPNTGHAYVEKTKRLFAECGKCQEGLKCFHQNEEFDVGMSSSVVESSKERSVKTPEVDAEEGEASSSESDLDTSVFDIRPEVQP